ncbi:MAG: hypothetical protein COV52_05545 [Gammaproteobacteria bacterium CG11_big_fil_rev_8_21_14_0_20_46_22]|nr:MAG: hypothetical protein COW05_08115 [Gammaproteobacteria bacterium CG12_big_fil_rev_8_21_14_0_65_46_12]PIR10969.1 MAG: hypothetical protein COV52_05545 [Gammaproteobacteria bacterium CG11_big_fil_rev_8_21_14_0_20_46_22]
MHKAIKLTALIGFSGLLGACAQAHKASNMPVKKTVPLNQVNEIVVTDVTQVTVQKTKSHPQISFITRPEQAPDMRLSSDHHRLTIEGNSASTHITIQASGLTLLSVNDVNHLSVGQGLRIKSMALNDVAQTRIRGTVYLDRLSLYNQSHLNAYAIWLKQLSLYDQSTANINTLSAKEFNLDMHGQTQAVISGHANVMQATLLNNSKLAAKRFYTQRAFVKAFGHSFARVSVRKTLFSFNEPTSVIEYYGTPKVYRRALNGSATLPMSKEASF